MIQFAPSICVISFFYMDENKHAMTKRTNWLINISKQVLYIWVQVSMYLDAVNIRLSTNIQIDKSGNK